MLNNIVEFGSVSKRYIFGKVVGDGMRVTYKSGDMIIADTNQKHFLHGDIFMLDMEQGVGTSVARLIMNFSKPGTVKLIYETGEGAKVSEIITEDEANKIVIGKIVGHVSREVFE